MLSVVHRFHGHGSLRYVYKNGQALRSHLVTVKYVTNPHRKHSRFAVVVSKKVHKSAVGRNRIRRRTYEVIRHEIPKLQKSHDVVIIAISSEIISLPAQELTQTIQDLFREAGFYQ